MKPEPPNASTSPISLLAIGFVIGAVVVGSSWLTTRNPASPNNDIQNNNVVHNVTVSYMYETSPGSASGNKNQPVASIQFYTRYIVVNRSSGHSELFAIDRLREFKFSPTKSK